MSKLKKSLKNVKVLTFTILNLRHFEFVNFDIGFVFSIQKL